MTHSTSRLGSLYEVVSHLESKYSLWEFSYLPSYQGGAFQSLLEIQMHAEQKKEKSFCVHDNRSVNSSFHAGQLDDVFPTSESYALGPRFYI